MQDDAHDSTSPNAVPSTSQGYEDCPDIHLAGHMQDHMMRMFWKWTGTIQLQTNDMTRKAKHIHVLSLPDIECMLTAVRAQRTPYV